MEKKYRRVTDIDEKIKDISLPYFQWKVLFLVLEETNIDELVKTLNSDDNTVQEALDSLVQNGILESEESAVDDAAAEKPEDVVEETQEEIEKVEKKPEEEQQEVEAEIVSETEDIVEEMKSEDSEAPIAELLDDASEDSTPEEENLTEDESEEQPSDKVDQELEAKEEPAPEEVIEEEFKVDSIEPEQEDVKLESLEEALEETEEEETKEDDGASDIGSFIDEIGSEEKVAEEKQDPESSEESKEEPKEERASADAKTIMVIDDSIVIRKMVEIALEDGDYNIVTSNSGKDGLKLLDDENPDLVIVDMTLPDMNGIDLLKTVKASKGIPVIMLSGKDAPQLVESAKSEGADDFLPKPFRDDDLIEKVKNLLK